MTNISVFFQGLGLGLAYVMPIGAQNIYMLQASTRFGLPYSFVVSLIIVLVDISLGISCFYGIGMLVTHHYFLSLALLLGGGIFLVYFGYILITSVSSKIESEKTIKKNVFTILLTCVFLTWFNPQAIIDGSLFLGAYSQAIPKSKHLLFLLGMGSASFLWFFSIPTLIWYLKNKISPSFFLKLNKVCGCILIVFSLRLFYTFFEKIRDL